MRSCLKDERMTHEDSSERHEAEEAALSPSGATLAALDDLLEALQHHLDSDVPEWEYCEGVMTALLCTRREVPQAEWLEMLFGRDADDIFPTAAGRTQFLMHWLEREQQLRAALQAPVQALDDEQALEPGVIDWRGYLSTLTSAEREQILTEQEPPQFAQAWAAGFLDAVDYWADDWALPRDKEIAADMRQCVQVIGALLKDDRATPTVNLFDESGTPTVSDARLEAFGEAIWAVYDLYATARSLGPRVAPAVSGKTGRNDPCPCGSGKKYKKCCGA
jgi:uncharacterized protein